MSEIIQTTTNNTVIQVFGERPVIPGVVGGAGSAELIPIVPVPGLNSTNVQDAIEELAPQTIFFTQSTLSVLNLLVHLHNYGKPLSTVEVLDDNNDRVIPDNIRLSTTAATVDLTSFVPLVGTWTLKVGI